MPSSGIWRVLHLLERQPASLQPNGLIGADGQGVNGRADLPREERPKLGAVDPPGVGQLKVSLEQLGQVERPGDPKSPLCVAAGDIAKENLVRPEDDFGFFFELERDRDVVEPECNRVRLYLAQEARRSIADG